MLGIFVGGWVCVFWVGLSVVKLGLIIVIKYVFKWWQFVFCQNELEILLFDYLSYQCCLMLKLVKVYVLYFVLMELSRCFVVYEEEDMWEIESLAVGLKFVVIWFIIEILQECWEVCGGKGYFWENCIVDLKVDIDIFIIFEGDNMVLVQFVAKGLLLKFKKVFNEEGNLVLFCYVFNWVIIVVMEQNFFVVCNIS